jgi:hypothetical protein
MLAHDGTEIGSDSSAFFGVAISTLEVAKPSADAIDRRYPDLAAKIREEWHQNGSHRDPSDRLFDQAVLHTGDKLPFGEIVATSTPFTHRNANTPATPPSPHSTSYSPSIDSFTPGFRNFARPRDDRARFLRRRWPERHPTSAARSLAGPSRFARRV